MSRLDEQDNSFSTVDETVAALAQGRMVVVVDSPDRENEGDLVMAADKITPAAVNFMAKHGRGLICVPMLRSRLDRLGIPPMATRNTDPKGTAFHVSVDHRQTSTGISASDRALTIAALAEPLIRSEDFTQPGHIFPLAYTEGGVLRRAGHTEASVDLLQMAGLSPTAVICEIAGEDGEMARVPQLREFARHHRLPLLAITDLIAHRRRSEPLVERVSHARIPLDQGEFTAVGYRNVLEGHEHVAFVYGDIRPGDDVLVRVHSECLTGDVFGSRRCDCGEQLDIALRMIADRGAGVVVYLRGHEGRGIGLLEKLHAYHLQDRDGLDTVEANLRLGHPTDARDYSMGVQILADLGVRRMRVLTNNPDKRAGLEGHDVEIVEQVALVSPPTPQNVSYLQTKQRRMGHLLGLPSTSAGAS